MPELESKFYLNQKVQFTIRNVLFVGKIVGIVFVEHGIFYDVEIDGNIYKSISEEEIEKI